MSEQETSRSVGSCSTSKTQGENLEDTGKGDTTVGAAQVDTSQGVQQESTTQGALQSGNNQENKNKGNSNLEAAKRSTRQEGISQGAVTENTSEESSEESITQDLSQDSNLKVAKIDISQKDTNPSEADTIQNDIRLSEVDSSQKDLSKKNNSQKGSKLSEEDTIQKDTKLSKVDKSQKDTTLLEVDTSQKGVKSKDTSQSLQDFSQEVKQEIYLEDTRQEAKESSISQGTLQGDTRQEGIQRNISQVANRRDTSQGAAEGDIKQGDNKQEDTRPEVLQVDNSQKGICQRDSSEEAAQGQCGPTLSTCISSDTGMGNTIFSSPEKSDSEGGDLKDDKNGIGCDYLRKDIGEGLSKNASSRNKENISSTREKIHSSDKSSEDSATLSEGLKNSVTVLKKSGHKEVQDSVSHIGKNKAEDCPSSSVDEGIDLHDSSDALENSGDEDNENIFEKAKLCDDLCGGDDSGVSADGKKGDTESTCNSSNTCETKLRLADMHETQEPEILARGEGVDILPKCIDKQQHKPDLSKENSSEPSQLNSQNIAKSNLHIEGTSNLGADHNSISGCSLGVVNRNLTENGNTGVEGCSVNAQGCTVDMLDCNVDADCYTPGDNLVCTDDPIRDTDSEAGDSCCSEDQDHGEACHGENGCVHGVDGNALDQNWDYVVDEEFNVPRKPIFNGSADQLERRSSLKRKASEEPEESKPAKCKRGIQFEGVTVFYFPRSQGFTCVPSQGGSSLGMSRRHSHIRQFSLAEHAVEQRRAHREYLMRLRQQRSARERGESSSRGSSSEDSEENSEEASDLSDSELDADSYYFLQPLPIRQRRALLRQAGICHIEGLEKEECKDIRISREMCGCQCKVYCDPDTCQCAQAGIKCQVDRHNFPCGCSREGCGNTFGRIEFNPIRVRTHFIHTLMRLEIEKRQSQQQHQQQQQQQQEWQQQQQRAKWLASSSAPANGFSGGSGLGGSNLPFFEGGRDSGGLPVTDSNKFNSSVEMGACVGSMNAPLYPHFESRQMLSPGGPSVYIQHDSVGDYNSGTCSVFGGLGATFDPSGAYGSCHGFPSASVVPPPPQVGPQVAPSQPTPPEAYNSLSKFANTTTSLVSPSFPYSGGVSPTATAAVPAVNCSYPQNNFCMTAVHDSTNGTVFGQYHDSSAVTQNLFKATVNECSDFQPNFEALSSSASADKAGRYIPAPSLVGQGKEMCGGEYTTETSVSSQSHCPGVIEDSYKVTEGGSSSSCSSSPHHTTDNTPELRLPQLPTSSAPPPPLSYDHGTPGKDTPSTEDPTEGAENLGEIVKKSMVETVSA